MEKKYQMTNLIKLNHFSLDRDTYEQRLQSGFYRAVHPDLSYEDAPTKDYDTFMDAVCRVNPELQWDKQSKMLDRQAVEEKLDHPLTRLLYLLDKLQEVGFALVKKPSVRIHVRFFEAANDNPEETIELDYLALE